MRRLLACLLARWGGGEVDEREGGRAEQRVAEHRGAEGRGKE